MSVLWEIIDLNICISGLAYISVPAWVCMRVLARFLANPKSAILMCWLSVVPFFNRILLLYNSKQLKHILNKKIDKV